MVHKNVRPATEEKIKGCGFVYKVLSLSVR